MEIFLKKVSKIPRVFDAKMVNYTVGRKKKVPYITTKRGKDNEYE